ncbi:alpha/beta hydrolase [Telluribacter humicola]
MTLLVSLATKAQSNGEYITNVVDNKGDMLYTTIYPNPGKETIILLHGGPGFSSDLMEVVDILKENFQVITFHQRGTKKSPCAIKDYSMDAYLSDIEAVRGFYKVDKFHLWGHSWGGLYAQVYADKYSDNLLSLFLCCPGSGTNLEWKQTEKEVMQLNKSKCTTWQWALMGWNNLLGMLGSDRAYGRLFTQVMKNYNDDFIDTQNLGVDFSNLKAEPINRTRPQIVKYPVLARQEQPAYPISIVYGDQDIYQTSKDFVINRYPTARVLTIKNSGHIPWLHNPADYKSILKGHYQGETTTTQYLQKQ